MDCQNCELYKRQFYCESCLRTHLRDYRIQTKHFAADREDQVAKAKKALQTTVEPSRLRRANLGAAQTRLDEVQAGLAKLRKENERRRERLRVIREDLATRRQTLSAARLIPFQPQPHGSNPPPDQPPSQEHVAMLSSLSSLSGTVAKARSGLVQELVEVFNVVEVGGRPPIGGKAGTKGEWTIGDLILPVPGDMRRYPPDHINAVLTHTVHFLSLLTFYLGIKLPFEVVWSLSQPPPNTGGSSPAFSTGKLGVGQPWIGAVRGFGTEHGGWARWSTKHPLHLLPTPPASSTSATAAKSTVVSPPALPENSVLLESVDSASSKPDASPSFPTALAMLLYNVCYLSYTQNVDVPLSQAGDVLSNLWGVCCASDLGKYSHSTAATLGVGSPPHLLYLPPPTPPSFQLDFARLLQATTVNPASRVRAKGRSGAGLDRTGSMRRGSVNSGRPLRIPEESKVDEDGWDLVDDGFGV